LKKSARKCWVQTKFYVTDFVTQTQKTTEILKIQHLWKDAIMVYFEDTNLELVFGTEENHAKSLSQ
jgi:hypothetical protein